MINWKKKAYQNSTNYLMQQQQPKTTNLPTIASRGGVDGGNVVYQMIPYILVKQIESYLSDGRCVVP